MNQAGITLRLHDRTGCVVDGGVFEFVAVVSAPLLGTVTVNGVVSVSGQAVSAAPWNLAGGTPAGAYPAPGSGRNGGNAVFYSLANVADAGKVTLLAIPI